MNYLKMYVKKQTIVVLQEISSNYALFMVLKNSYEVQI